MYDRTGNKNSVTHGARYTSLYRRYVHIKDRCNNPRNCDFGHYGGRGIKISEEWSSFEAFRDWANIHGHEERLTIDRIDNDKDYGPDNCRWVSQKIQAINKRLLKPNVTGYPGVYYKKISGKYEAYVGINGKRHYLGTFITPEEASVAYLKAKQDRDALYYKEFEESKNKRS